MLELVLKQCPLTCLILQSLNYSHRDENMLFTNTRSHWRPLYFSSYTFYELQVYIDCHRCRKHHNIIITYLLLLTVLHKYLLLKRGPYLFITPQIIQKKICRKVALNSPNFFGENMRNIRIWDFTKFQASPNIVEYVIFFAQHFEMVSVLQLP